MPLPFFVSRLAARTGCRAAWLLACAMATSGQAPAAELAARIAEQAVPDARDDPAPTLGFDRFFRQPIGARGLAIEPALQAADGRQVRLVGFMVSQERPLPGRLLLTPRPVRMSEHADGDADDLPPATVTVLFDPTQGDRVAVHQAGLVALTGRLSVGRVEDPTTGRVSWVRLHLPPQALSDNRLRAFEARRIHFH